MNINERKLKILQLVINDFIINAEPVGSKTIKEKNLLNVSSATIRNEMAGLEALGYLIQPYTSAGRIPSELGYRIYVDNLMKMDVLDYEEREVIKNLLLNNVIEVEDVIRQALGILTGITDMTTIVSLPQFNKSKLTNLKLINVNNSKVLMVFISDSGIVKNIQLPIEGVNQEVLDLIGNVILKKLKGSNISEITVKKISKIKSELPYFREVIDYIIPVLRDTLKNMDDIDVKLDGINKIFDLPEFQDVKKVKDFLTTLEDKEVLRNLLSCEHDQKISVKIGEEVGLEEINGCSVISAGYKISGVQVGRIGIIGPIRMNYPGMISTINYVADTLTEIFSGIHL
ncbi:MAG: heat-inducible transcriptional repressor HrcA [Bacillota bacterium]|nr:heat-inducible transcriptional repressor HrcA [Bacillota bacterium]